MSRRLALGCLISLSSMLVASPAAAAAVDVDYVALGDSYSSGVGAPGSSGTCGQSPYGYPALWAAANEPLSFTNLTCGGAVTGDVVNTQVPQIPDGTDLVSITIGGNDAGFSPTLLTCQLSSDEACAQAVADAEETIGAELPGKLDATYAAIAAAAPGAQVVVLGYPQLFDESATTCDMSLAKRQALNAGALVLNGVIQDRAEAAGFTFSDVVDDFAGHGVCSAQPYINGLVLLPAQDSYHPNQAGYENGYLPAFSGAVG